MTPLLYYKEYFCDKVVLVTGGAGLIGTDLILKLSSLNVKSIVCVDIKPRPNVFNNIILNYIQIDANNLTIETLKNIDPQIIFHLAATFERTIETIEFYNDNFINNVKLNNHMGSLYRQLKNLERVIFASSYLIYNSNLYTFTDPQTVPVIINENTEIYPRNICGGAKLLHETELNYMQQFAQNNFTAVMPRIYRVYGPGECGRLGGTVINRWIDGLIKNENDALNLFAKEGMFDYIYSEDVSFALMLLASSTHKGIINLGKGDARTIQNVIEILKLHFPKIQYYETFTNQKYEACQSNMDKFYEITGWRPTITLEQGIEKCIKKKIGIQ